LNIDIDELESRANLSATDDVFLVFIFSVFISEILLNTRLSFLVKEAYLVMELLILISLIFFI
jgi:hypothetical protein